MVGDLRSICKYGKFDKRHLLAVAGDYGSNDPDSP
jgi:hypothetical protein